MSAEYKKNKLSQLKDSDDLVELRLLAIERWGLVHKDFRSIIWPKLYNVKSDEIPPKPDASKLQQHKDYEQVVMDVNRSLKRFPPGMDETVRMSLQDKLVDLIMRVLVRNKELHYYQGYHDICVTFLLVLDEDTAFAVVEKLSQTHLRLFMGPDMSETSDHLQLIHIILADIDPALSKRFDEASLPPLYALSWVITWFGHVLGDVDRILRLYDFFLASDPTLMPLYVSAALVLHCTEAVMACDPDFALLHHCLSNLPSPDLPLEDIISSAARLFHRLPPDRLMSRAGPGLGKGRMGSGDRTGRVTRNRGKGRTLDDKTKLLALSALILVIAVMVGVLARYVL